jgi:hypothetical protein
MFSQLAGSYELAITVTVALGATTLAVRAFRFGDGLWAAALGLVAITFCPISLPNKLFLVMGYTCILTLFLIVASFRSSRRDVAPDCEKAVLL